MKSTLSRTRITLQDILITIDDFKIIKEEADKRGVEIEEVVESIIHEWCEQNK